MQKLCFGLQNQCWAVMSWAGSTPVRFRQSIIKACHAGLFSFYPCNTLFSQQKLGRFLDDLSHNRPKKATPLCPSMGAPTLNTWSRWMTPYVLRPSKSRRRQACPVYFLNRFKKKLDFQPPRVGFKKNFHSFCNTFINAAKQARVEIEMIKETVGHASALGNRQQSMSGDYYASDYSERIRYEELMLNVKFAIDLSQLHSSKYAGKN